MNQNHFLEFVNSVLNGKIMADANLEEIVAKYPYCQTGQTLHYLMLLQNNNISHYQQLRLTSAYSSDRKRLKELTERYRKLQKISFPDHQQLSESGASESRDTVSASPEEVIRIKEIDTPQNVEEPKPQEPSIRNIDTEKKSKKPESTTESEITETEAKSDKASQTRSNPVGGTEKTKQELIDRFIRNSPRISRSKSDFYDPEDYSKSSQIDKEDIVSETLATIYFKQGNYPKAITTYQKLILKVPQKSSFFAAQIEKIKEVQNLNN